MSSTLSRAVNGIIGSLVADAATMGLHWIYDQGDVAIKVGEKGGVAAFYQPPACPFYTYESGKLSPYGDEVIPFLKSFTEVHGLQRESAASESYLFFKSYTGRLNHVTKQFVANHDAGASWEDSTIVDHQAQGIIKIPLVVARYAGHADLLRYVEEAVLVLHKSEISVSASKLLAVILERILLTSDSPAAAIEWAATAPEALERLDDVGRGLIRFINNDELLNEFTKLAARLMAAPVTEASARFKKMGLLSKITSNLVTTQSLSESLAALGEEDQQHLASINSQLDEGAATGEAWARLLTDSDCSINAVALSLGLSCALPSALLTSLYVARKTASYKAAVEANVLAAGDNCSRSIVLGGLFGFASDNGVSHIPIDWIESTNPQLVDQISTSARLIASDNNILA